MVVVLVAHGIQRPVKTAVLAAVERLAEVVGQTLPLALELVDKVTTAALALQAMLLLAVVAAQARQVQTEQ